MGTYTEDSYGMWPGAAPAYQSSYDPLSMSLAQKVKALTGNINLDQSGLNAFKQQALRTGPSLWANQEMNRQNLEETTSRQRLGREGAGRTAEGESALAMRGGLTSGARERLRTNATHDYLDMSQNVSRQAGLNRLQIQSQDEQNRISQLGQLPGMQIAALQPELDKAKMMGQADASDIANQVNEGNRRNEYNRDIWGKQMEAWGANRTADATENAGKK